MADRKWQYGKAVTAGKLNYVSASALTTADPSSDGGCMRKWYYAQVMGIKSPPSKSQEIGIELHGQIESYLKTGVMALGPLAASGMFMIPTPGPDLGVELDIAMNPGIEMVAHDAELEGKHELAATIRATATLADAPLRINDVPVVGFIDLVHGRGTNKGGSDIEDTIDPPNTVEVLDWKTTGDPRWIKSAEKMAQTTQMTIYGKWVFEVIPNVEHVRLSHGYFVTKGSGRARKVSLRVTREQIDRQMEHIAGTVRYVQHAAAATNPNDVDANTNSCDSFGGCPAREVCTAGMQSSLASMLGQTAAENLLRNRLARKEQQQMTTAPSGMLARILAKNANPPAAAAPQVPTPTPPAPVAAPSPRYTAAITAAFGSPPTAPTAPTAPVAPPVVDHAAELARIQAEERAAALARLPAGFADALARVEAHGIGMPMLTGACAMAYATVKNITLKSPAIAGIGDLAKANDGKGLSEPAWMIQVADELDAMPPMTQAMGILPADVPESDPALAAAPDPAFVAAVKPASGEKVAQMPTAPDPMTAGNAPGPALAAVVAQAAPKAKRRSKAEMEAARAAEAAPTAAPPSPEVIVATPEPRAFIEVPAPAEAMTTTTTAYVAVPPIDNKIYFYVGCRPSCKYELFAPIVDAICAELAESQGVDDIRNADKGPLGFAKWKVVLGQFIAETVFPTNGEVGLPPGHWVLDTVGDIADVVAETMRKICKGDVGVFVR